MFRRDGKNHKFRKIHDKTDRKSVLFTSFVLQWLKDNPNQPLTKSILRNFMDKAGYSATIPPSKVIKKNSIFQENVNDLLVKANKVRNQLIDEMGKDERIKDSRYQELTSAFDVLTKNIQLLQGKATEKIDIIALAKEIEAAQDPLVKE